MKKFYKNILSQEAANDSYHSFMQIVLKDSNTYYEKETTATEYKTYAYGNLPATLREMDSIDKIIKNDFGQHYEFTHSYIRLYPDQSILNPHVDRPGLDLTLTVNIFSVENNPYPIHFSNIPLDMKELTVEHTSGTKNCYNLFQKHMKDYETYVTEIGDGVCCTRDIPHWRDRYKVKELGEHFVQVFYHWKVI
jgi:hypothetical protein